MKLSIIGAGFVGLTYAFVFAKHTNYDITVYDIDSNKINMLRSKKLPFREESINKLLANEPQLWDKIVFTNNKSDIVGSDAYIVCIGTYTSEGYSDRNLFKFFKENDVSGSIVLKSTVKPGTTRAIKELLESKNMVYKEDFYLVYNPEFLREGTAFYDAVSPDKIVIGVGCNREEEIALELYKFIPDSIPRIITNWDTAEMIKLAQNAFLSLKISFANDLLNIAWIHRLDVDFNVLAKALELDPRIGKGYLYPGLGFGGSCLPKDTRLLAELESETGYRLVHEIVRINDDMIDKIIARLQEKYGELRGKKILVVGISFKEGTDDLRDSKPLELALKMSKLGCKVYWYDEDIPEEKEIHGIKPGRLDDKYDLVLITKNTGKNIEGITLRSNIKGVFIG